MYSAKILWKEKKEKETQHTVFLFLSFFYHSGTPAAWRDRQREETLARKTNKTYL